MQIQYFTIEYDSKSYEYKTLEKSYVEGLFLYNELNKLFAKLLSFIKLEDIKNLSFSDIYYLLSQVDSEQVTLLLMRIISGVEYKNDDSRFVQLDDVGINEHLKCKWDLIYLVAYEVIKINNFLKWDGIQSLLINIMNPKKP